ncbi:MAG: SDR family oxidoreductase [Bacteroidales bacterium]|nr:SDR family oxidoreductase [Bacteroidales bacterium]
MKILVTGNLGYVGSELTKLLRQKYPDAELIGFDLGMFSKQLTNELYSPEIYLNKQIYGDVRNFPEELLDGVDTVVQLAAISNDPIGNKFEQITSDVNYKAVVDIAQKAKKRGVKRVIFASSCSVYGLADDSARTETSEVNPLTAYAKSKVNAEKALKPLADENFTVTCLRFATACGMSDRLRLDLVLNDFVAGAYTTNEITILSDGSPWRPLINVRDMGRAIIWAHERTAKNGGNYVIVNTGSNEWNYQVKELAYAINKVLPDVKVSINKDAQPDKRSYKVDFAKYKEIAPDHQPIYDLNTSINDLLDGFKKINFSDKNFRTSRYMRLQVVNELIEKKILDEKLKLL